METIREHRPKVRLTGVNGNALALVNECRKVLKAAGFSREELDRFQKEALSGDYDHVLQTCMRWCEVS